MGNRKIGVQFLKKLLVYLRLNIRKMSLKKKLFKAKDNLTRLRDIIIQNENRYTFLKGQSIKAKTGITLLQNIEKAEFSISYKNIII